LKLFAIFFFTLPVQWKAKNLNNDGFDDDGFDDDDEEDNEEDIFAVLDGKRVVAKGATRRKAPGGSDVGFEDRVLEAWANYDEGDEDDKDRQKSARKEKKDVPPYKPMEDENNNDGEHDDDDRDWDDDEDEAVIVPNPKKRAEQEDRAEDTNQPLNKAPRSAEKKPEAKWGRQAPAGELRSAFVGLKDLDAKRAVKLKTNTTEVRGLKYETLVATALARQPQGNIGEETTTNLLRSICDHLSILRQKDLELWRLITLAGRSFGEILRVTLQQSNEARRDYFNITKKGLFSIHSGLITSLTETDKKKAKKEEKEKKNLTPMKDMVRMASLVVVDSVKQGRKAWSEMSGSPQHYLSSHRAHELRESNARAALAESNRLSNTQGAKVREALLAAITSHKNFSGEVVSEWKTHTQICRKLVNYKKAIRLACFPEDVAKESQDGKEDESSGSEGDDDADGEGEGGADEDDVEEDDDDSDGEKDDQELQGEPRLELEQKDLNKITNFDRLATEVVAEVVGQVVKDFPQLDPKQPRKGKKKGFLPARSTATRRMVLDTLCRLFPAALLNGERNYNIAPDAKTPPREAFHADGAVCVTGSIYLGGLPAAMGALAHGFGAVVSCAAGLPRLFDAGHPIAGLHFEVPAGSSISVQQLKEAMKFLHKHRDDKTLVHGVQNNSHSAAIVLAWLLQENFQIQDALGMILNAHPGTTIDEADFSAAIQCAKVRKLPYSRQWYLQQWFDQNMAPALQAVDFKETILDFRIRQDNIAIPARALTPVYERTCPQYELVDHAILVGVLQLEAPTAISFFAKALVKGLNAEAGSIILIPSSTSASSGPIGKVVDSMCDLDPRMSKFDLASAAPPQDARYVIVHDLVDTGLEILTRIKQSCVRLVPNMTCIALGRVRGERNEYRQSPWIVVNQHVEPLPTVFNIRCETKPAEDLMCDKLRKIPDKGKWLATFYSQKAAIGAAKKLLALSTECEPDFPVEGEGYPCVKVARLYGNFIQVTRGGPAELFLLERLNGEEGKKRGAATQKAQQEWKQAQDGDATRSPFEAKSKEPLAHLDLEKVREMLTRDFKEGGWEVLETGVIRCKNKGQMKAILKAKWGPLGLAGSKAHGPVLDWIWIPSPKGKPTKADLKKSHESSVERIRCMASPASVVTTSWGANMTRKIVSQHDPATILYVEEKSMHVPFPDLRRGIRLKWGPSMVHCNPALMAAWAMEALFRTWEGYVGFPNPNGRLTKDQQGVVQRKRPDLEKVVDKILEPLTAAGVASFDGKDKIAARDYLVEAAIGPRKKGAGDTIGPMAELEATLASFSLNVRDITRAMRKGGDHLCGITTGGTGLTYLRMHKPDMKWRGRTENLMSTIARKDLADQTFPVSQLSAKEAEQRIAVVAAILPGIVREMGPSETLLAQLNTNPDARKEAEETQKRIEQICKKSVQCMSQLERYISESKGWDAATLMRSTLARRFEEALNVWGDVFQSMKAVQWRTYSEDQLEKGKKKRDPGSGPDDKEKKKALLAVSRAEAMRDRLLQIVRHQKNADQGQDKCIPAVNSAEEAAMSVHYRALGLVAGCDPGVGDSRYCVIPGALADYLFKKGHAYNFDSQSKSATCESSDGPQILFGTKDLNLKRASATISLSEGLLGESTKRKEMQAKRNEHKKAACNEMRIACIKALEKDGTSDAARRLAQLMQRIAGPSNDSTELMDMCGAIEFTGSATSSILSICERLFVALPVLQAYNAPCFSEARAITRRGEDKISSMLINYIEILSFKCQADPLFQLMNSMYSTGRTDVLKQLKIICELEKDPKRKQELVTIVDACPQSADQQMEYLILEGCKVVQSKAMSPVEYSKREAHTALKDARALTDPYSQNAVVYACRKATMDEDYDFVSFLQGINSNSTASQERVSSCIDINGLLRDLQDNPSKQRETLLASAWNAIIDISDDPTLRNRVDLHDELPAYMLSDPDEPPVAQIHHGNWRRGAGRKGVRWRSGWHATKHRKAVMRGLRRRAKWRQDRVRKKNHPRGVGERKLQAEPGHRQAIIFFKETSEVRSSRHLGTRLRTILTGERINTCAPSKEDFGSLRHAASWKLRTAKAEDFNEDQPRYIVQRDHLGSFAIAWLGWWERKAFAYNQYVKFCGSNTGNGEADRTPFVLPRPAAYLFHTNYQAWQGGVVDVDNIFKGGNL
jgi:hypothetical protein